MNTFAELDITIRGLSENTYSVEMQSTLPDSDTINTTSGEAQFDLDEFRGLSLKSGRYARLLTDCLLRDQNLRTAFSDARATAQARDLSLQLRLRIEPGADRLHGLRWETLLDPRDERDDNYLFTGEAVLFSRYLNSTDWKLVKPRPRSALTALVVVANPSNLDKFRLAAIDVKGELQRAHAAISGVRSVAELASAGSATLKDIADRLRSKPVDILYLVCHGGLVDNEPILWLENSQGQIDRVAGEQLVACIRDLERRPRLVVLASCQSAGAGDPLGSLAALAPRLIAAGVPAVVGMQGSVSMNTAGQFMPAFFKQLLRSGRIDLAVAAGRSVVRREADFWMPVLFMRLKSGRIWSADSIAGKALVSPALRGPLLPALRRPSFLAVFLIMLLAGNWISKSAIFEPLAGKFGDFLLRTQHTEDARFTRVVRIETQDLDCVFGGARATGQALINVVKALADSAPEAIIVDIDTSDAESFPGGVKLPNFGAVKVIWALNADFFDPNPHNKFKFLSLKAEGLLGGQDRENVPHGIAWMPEDFDGTLRTWKRAYDIDGREEKSLAQAAVGNYCRDCPQETAFARDYRFLPQLNLLNLVPASARVQPKTPTNQAACGAADVTTPDLRLTGKIVILGGFHPGSDWHDTPWGTKYGAEMVANAIEEEKAHGPAGSVPGFLKGFLKWTLKILIGIGIAALHHYFRPIWATVLTVLFLPIAVMLSGLVIFWYGDYELAVVPLVVGILVEQLVSSVQKADHFVELAEQYS